MRGLLAIAAAALLSVAAPPRYASADEAAAKQAFLACGQGQDLRACDELIAMPDLDDAVRSNGYAVRGMVKLQLGDNIGAEADLRWALALNPDNDVAQRTLDLMAQSSVDPSVAIFQKCTKHPDIKERIAACNTLVQEKQSDPSRRAAMLDLRAAAFLDNSQFDKAISDLNEVVRLDPSYDQAVEHLIVAQSWSGNYEGALRTTNTKLASPGSLPEAKLLHYQGNLLYLTGNSAEAIAAYDESYAKNSMSLIARFWSAVVRLEQGEDATPILREMSNQPLLGAFGMAMAKFRLGEATDAEVLAEANAVLGEARQDALCMAYFNIGHRAWLEGRKADARRNFEAAIATNRKRTQDYHAAAKILRQL